MNSGISVWCSGTEVDQLLYKLLSQLRIETRSWINEKENSPSKYSISRSGFQLKDTIILQILEEHQCTILHNTIISWTNIMNCLKIKWLIMLCIIGTQIIVNAFTLPIFVKHAKFKQQYHILSKMIFKIIKGIILDRDFELMMVDLITSCSHTICLKMR